MCVMSMVTDGIKQQWPPLSNYIPPYKEDKVGAGIWPLPQWDPESIKLLRDALRAIDALDKKFDTIKCSDERKDQLIKLLEEKVAQYEKKNG